MVREPRKKLILSDAAARARRLAGRDRSLAKTGATSRKRAARRSPAMAPRFVVRGAERKMGGVMNPNCDTSGAGWRDRGRDGDL